PEIVPGQPAVGPDISWEIVGVVSEERVSLFNPTMAGLYAPIQQSPPMYINLVVQARTPAAFLKPSVARVIHDINRDQAISDLGTIEEDRKFQMTMTRQQTILLAAFTGVAVLLGALGIYALISFLITQRTGEIGIRMALGSTPASVVRLVLGRVMSWT